MKGKVRKWCGKVLKTKNKECGKIENGKLKNAGYGADWRFNINWF